LRASGNSIQPDKGIRKDADLTRDKLCKPNALPMIAEG
tara:strand:+ start:1282 stop:1395 length:114 start_codon:yes stop_codon:yes gene_type:complete